MNRVLKGMALILILVTGFSSHLCAQINTSAPKETKTSLSTVVKDLFSQVELFSYALTTIQAEYVDEKTPQELIYGALRGMLSSLDPHSHFLEPEEYQELKSETQGKFGGLGIEISIQDGLLTVISPIEDTPAWKAGLKPGDRIVKIEAELTKDITLNEAVKKLRGEPGTDVNITVLREDEFKLYDFKITREIIKIQDVKDVQILEDKIGYIRLTEFRENSNREIIKALTQLKKDEADSLILDLRNNPGGLLNVAIDVTNQFLPDEKVIVSTKGRRKSQDMESFSKPAPNKITDWPIVVLINQGSASGSEILAGALKDNKRAIIVGEQSFGKGSVQSVIPLPDGSGIRLTTSKYFTPSGESIHGEGIAPDVLVKYVYPKEEEEPKEEDKEIEVKIKQTEKNIDQIFEDVEIKSSDDPEKLKMEKKTTLAREKLLKDNQVQAAINVLKGIKTFSTFD